MQVLYGDHHHIHCTGIDDLRRAWDEGGGKPVVFTSDCPDGEISDLFLGFDAPRIAFIDEPEDAIAFAIVSRPMEAREAIRFSSRHFCSMQDILLDPHTVCFPSFYLNEDVRDVVTQLLQILAGSVDQDVLEAVMQRAVDEYQFGRYTTVADQVAGDFARFALPSEVLAQQPPEILDLIKQCSDIYRPLLRRMPLVSLRWPLGLVYTSNEGNGNPHRINLTGPARVLTWGPYLHLPKGNWKAQIEFEIIENYSGALLKADIYDGNSLLIVAETALPVAGKFQFELPFNVCNPNYPIEVRMCLAKGAIEGKFGLTALTLHRAETEFG
jgi:hypothetical protein